MSSLTSLKSSQNDISTVNQSNENISSSKSENSSSEQIYKARLSQASPQLDKESRIATIKVEATPRGAVPSAQLQVGDSTKKLYSYSINGLVYSYEANGLSIGFTEAEWYEIINTAQKTILEQKINTERAFSLHLGTQTISQKDEKNRDVSISFQRENQMSTLYDLLEKHSGITINSKLSNLQGRVNENPQSPIAVTVKQLPAVLEKTPKKKNRYKIGQQQLLRPNYSNEPVFLDSSGTSEEVDKSNDSNNNSRQSKLRKSRPKSSSPKNKKQNIIPLHSVHNNGGSKSSEDSDSGIDELQKKLNRLKNN